MVPAGHDDNFLGGYLPYLLRRADQALSSAFYAVLKRYGVARSEWRVLAVLQDVGDLSILDLTVASLSPQPTVTHAVRRLEERGLVARTLGADDRRQRIVSITTTGAELTAILIEEAKQLEAEALAEAGDLSDLMAKLTELTEIVETNVGNRADRARVG
ncbi:MAG: MarR family transcriptional regulator [Acidimicrobiia bacterium]|nr:MarR family transcriptional regulator [Acidimicrobiia bacterium]